MPAGHGHAHAHAAAASTGADQPARPAQPQGVPVKLGAPLKTTLQEEISQTNDSLTLQAITINPLRKTVMARVQEFGQPIAILDSANFNDGGLVDIVTKSIQDQAKAGTLKMGFGGRAGGQGQAQGGMAGRAGRIANRQARQAARGVRPAFGNNAK